MMKRQTKQTNKQTEQSLIVERWLTRNSHRHKALHQQSAAQDQRLPEMIVVQSLYVRGKDKQTNNPIKVDKKRLSREMKRD